MTIKSTYSPARPLSFNAWARRIHNLAARADVIITHTRHATSAHLEAIREARFVLNKTK